MKPDTLDFTDGLMDASLKLQSLYRLAGVEGYSVRLALIVDSVNRLLQLVLDEATVEGEPYEDTYFPGIADYDRFGRPSWGEEA